MIRRRQINAADLFCGAGGTSEGLLMAANEMEADLTLVAVNHWQVAIDTHSLNHPYAQHLCTGLDSITDPRKLFPTGRLNVLCASPECTHHSVARGGKPMSDQSRASAWHILRFAEAVYIENIVIENVPEFVSWGPLGANGRPLKSRRGELFQQLIASLKALGYRHVEWKELVCADYGDPTTRKRLFIIARRNKAIRWPAPTHVPASQVSGLFAEARKPWRTAREIIDWTIPSRSIFERKRPLADKTLLRIQAGLKKFCGLDVDLKRCFNEDLRPFLVVLRGTGTTASVDAPLNTVTANGNHYGLVQPFLSHFRGDHAGRADGAQRNGSLCDPLPTQDTSNRFGVVDPFLVQAGGPEGKGRNPLGMSEPMATVVGENHTAVVQPFLVPQFSEREGQNPRTHSISDPTPAVTSHGAGALVEPFLVTVNHGEGDTTRRAQSVDTPLGTATSKIGTGIAGAFLLDVTRMPQSVDAPLGTATSHLGAGICEPFLIAYYGTQNMSAVGEPLPTVVTKERFGLVEAEVTHYRLDIRFRMLQPSELARAQGFPDSYKFTGNREAVVKQIGNAVPPNTAKALMMEVLQ